MKTLIFDETDRTRTVVEVLDDGGISIGEQYKYEDQWVYYQDSGASLNGLEMRHIVDALATPKNPAHVRFDQFVEDSRVPEENPFEPPPRIVCPNCDGDLKFDQPNQRRNLAFVTCVGDCKQVYSIGFGP